jgi:HK97 family phage major capsid protein
MKTRKIILGLVTLLFLTMFAGTLDANPAEGTLAVTTAFALVVGGIKSSKELKESKAGIWERAQAIHALAKEEKRDLTEDQNTEYDGLIAEMRELDKEIKRAEEHEARTLEMANTHINSVTKKQEQKEVRSYSFVKAIRSKAEGKALEGLEAEMDQEAKREATTNGVAITGIGIPSIVLSEKRDLTEGTDNQGGYLSPTDTVGFIEALRAKMLVTQYGAQVMTGLMGNISMPTQATAASAAWEGEVDAGSEQSQTFGELSLTPNRLGCYTEISKQLIIQSSIDVENFVRNDLIMAIQLAIDLAAINGSGSSDQPTGILNTSGIGSVAGGTNGLAPTFGNLVNLEREVSVDNADIGNLAFMTNPKVRAKLKQTELDSGSGLFVWPSASDELLGYKAGVTTQVPSTLDKGTSTGVCSAIIFGNWNDLIVAQWGGLDIVVDPYSLATTNMLRVVANSWWDVGVRHAQSFAAMADALTT